MIPEKKTVLVNQQQRLANLIAKALVDAGAPIAVVADGAILRCTCNTYRQTGSCVHIKEIK